MKSFIKLEPPYEWVRVSNGKVEAFGQVASLAEYPVLPEYELVGVVPGEFVTAHRVTIPAKNRKQFTAALPFALEELLSEDIESLHFSCANWKSGTQSIVQVVGKDKMQYWQSLANEHKLPIERLVPDHALIPAHEAAEYTLSQCDDHLLAKHKDGYGVSLDDQLLELWLNDIPLDAIIAVNDQTLTHDLIEKNPNRDVRHWPFGNKLAHWLDYPIDINIDLWGTQFRPKVRNINLNVFALPIMLCLAGLVIKLGYDSVRYFSYHAEIANIAEMKQQTVQQALPELGEVAAGQEKIVMEAALRRLNANSNVVNAHTMLADLSKVLARQNVSIESIDFRDDKYEVVCLLNDFSQVDLISRQLNALSRLTASLQSSASDQGQILATYELKPS